MHPIGGVVGDGLAIQGYEPFDINNCTTGMLAGWTNREGSLERACFAVSVLSRKLARASLELRSTVIPVSSQGVGGMVGFVALSLFGFVPKVQRDRANGFAQASPCLWNVAVACWMFR